MNKAIVVTRPQDWAMIDAIAPTTVKTRWFGLTEPQAKWCLLAGHELGFSFTGALEVIKPIHDRPTLTPRGHLALLHASGLFSPPGYIKVEDIYDGGGNPVACRVSMKRNDTQFEYSVEWTIENAAKAGLVKDKSGWDKYPANMLRWITLGFCADVVAPDIAALRRTIEFGEPVDQNGDPVVWSEATTTIGAIEGAVSSQPHLREMPRYPLPIPDASVGLLSKSQLEGESTTRPLPPVPASISDPFVPFPIPTIDSADSEPDPIPGSDTIETAGYPATIAALIDAGYTVEQIVKANEGRVPSTAEDCIKVAKKLEEEQA